MNFLRKRPEVSVILAAYNHESFVEEAVRSVLNQSYENLELIIVDDASTDRTADVVRSFRDPRIRFYQNQYNRQHHPRNYALSHVRGNWVAFQNSDDVWLQDKLSVQLDRFKRRPKQSVVFTDVELIDSEGQIQEGRGCFLDPGDQPSSPRVGWLRRFFLQHNCVAIASALIRSQDLKRTGGMNPQFRQLADFDLWVRLAAMGGCALHPQALTKVRIFNDSSNMSAPNPNVRRRSYWELLQVMRYFSHDNVLLDLPEILPELALRKTDSAVVRKVSLAQYSATASAQHLRGFGEWLLQHLLENEYRELERGNLVLSVTDSLFAVRASMEPPQLAD